MRKFTVVLILLMIALSIMGCNKEISLGNNVVINDVNKLYSETIQLLNGTPSSELDYFEDSVEIIEADYYLCTEDTVTQNFLADNAYYIKVGTYMYRFQFNSDSKIESYIKYKLRA